MPISLWLLRHGTWGLMVAVAFSPLILPIDSIVSLVMVHEGRL